MTLPYLCTHSRKVAFGGLNYWRNLDQKWESEAAFQGLHVNVPAMYLVGERDTGLAIPGMKAIINAMPSLVS